MPKVSDSNSKNSSTDQLQDLEPLVKLYQETRDDRFFEIIHATYRRYIQGRAFTTAFKYGLDECDCESALSYALYKAVEQFDFARGIPFAAFVNIKFDQALVKFMYNENRKDNFYSPKNNIPESTSCELIYYFAEDNWDMVDVNPRSDVENLIAEQDSAKSLLMAIDKVDATASKVAALTACGYSQREVACALDYNPIGTVKSAQNKWVIRKLAKCIPPAIRHYKEMGVPIPIKLKC